LRHNGRENAPRRAARRRWVVLMTGVSKLTVCGYKSIRELRDFPLTNLNVLIGANGAGKSNFISLFKLLNEIFRGNLQLYVQKNGGPDAFLHFGRKVTEEIFIHIMVVNEESCFKIFPSVDNEMLCTASYNEKIINFNAKKGFIANKLDDVRSTLENVFDTYIALEILKKCRVYHFHDVGETAKVKQRHGTNDNLLLKPDAANLAAYLRMLRRQYPDSYDRIVDVVRMAAPFFDDFVDRPGEPEFIELEWTQVGHDDTPLKAFMLSDGTLRFICLATLLLQPAALMPSTVLIDEPELGLHPYAISLLAALMKRAAETTQLIVSTQSVELVNELTPEDVIVVDYEDGQSTFRRLESDDLAHWLEDYALGDLWKRNIFGGRP
jgi:predicted ATPase